MAEFDNEKNEKQCINCGEKINDKCELDKYPHEFSVYLCPECGYENDWWMLYNFGKNTNRESIIRALFLDSFLQRKEINYDQVIHHIKEKCEDENLLDDAIQNDLNSLFIRVLEKKKLKRIDILKVNYMMKNITKL